MTDDVDTCPKCGKAVDAVVVRCPACGHQVRRCMSADEARRLADEIARGCQAIDNGWTYIAKRLHALNEHAGYTALGHPTLAAWIEASPLRLTAGRGIRLLRIYRFFVVEHEIAEDEIADVPPSRLARLKKPVQDGRVQPREAVEEARVFTEHELGEHYHDTVPPAQRASAFVQAVKTIRQAQLPGLEDRRLVVVPIPADEYDRLVAAHVLIEREDGLVDLRIPQEIAS